MRPFSLLLVAALLAAACAPGSQARDIGDWLDWIKVSFVAMKRRGSDMNCSQYLALNLGQHVAHLALDTVSMQRRCHLPCQHTCECAGQDYWR